MVVLSEYFTFQCEFKGTLILINASMVAKHCLKRILDLLRLVVVLNQWALFLLSHWVPSPLKISHKRSCQKNLHSQFLAVCCSEFSLDWDLYEFLWSLFIALLFFVYQIEVSDFVLFWCFRLLILSALCSNIRPYQNLVLVFFSVNSFLLSHSLCISKVVSIKLMPNCFVR